MRRARFFLLAFLSLFLSLAPGAGAYDSVTIVTLKDLFNVGDDLFHNAVLVKALGDDDPAPFERYLRTHPNINRLVNGELSLLHAAVGEGKPKVVKFLLDRKASVLPKDYRGRRVLEYLDDPELQKRPGFAEIAAMVRQRAEEELGDNEKNPAWGYICDGEREKLALLLKNQGVDVNLRNRRLESLLFYAIKHDELWAAELLLMAYGADDWLDDGHEVPARYAMYLKQVFARFAPDKAAQAAIAELRKALAAGWQVNAQDPQTGRTRLMDECERGNYRVARFLIAKRADPKLKDKSGKDAYDYARGYHPESDQLLAILDRGRERGIGAVFSMRPSSGAAPGQTGGAQASGQGPTPGSRRTPHAAAPAQANLDADEKAPAWAYVRDRANDKLQERLKSGAVNANLQNRSGETLLFYALKAANLDAVEALLVHGADPDIPDVRGRTPRAFVRELTALFDRKRFADAAAEIDRLCRFGLRIDAPQHDPEGLTRLMEACKNGDCQMAEFLISRGANPNKRDKHGKTAYDYARAYHPMSDKLVELLGWAGHMSE